MKWDLRPCVCVCVCVSYLRFVLLSLVSRWCASGRSQRWRSVDVCVCVCVCVLVCVCVSVCVCVVGRGLTVMLLSVTYKNALLSVIITIQRVF